MSSNANLIGFYDSEDESDTIDSTMTLQNVEFLDVESDD